MQESEDERQPPEVIVSDTPNATQIPVDQAPSHKQDKYERLRAYNNGTWNGPKREIKEVTHRQDNLQRYDALSSSLPLTDYQKKRGKNVLDRLDLGDLGIKIDAVIFAVCVLVANADHRNTRYWPQEKEQDSQFASIADDLGLSWKKQMSVIKKIQSRVDL